MCNFKGMVPNADDEDEDEIAVDSDDNVAVIVDSSSEVSSSSDSSEALVSDDDDEAHDESYEPPGPSGSRTAPLRGGCLELEEEDDDDEEEEEEEEDEVVQAIRKARENIRELPRDIHTEDHVVEVCFHPQEEIIALASITGDVLLYKYCDDKDAELTSTLELHTKPCRDIEFSQDGSILFSVAKDKSMMLTDVATGKLKQAYDNAHDEPLFCLTVLNENQVVTGDQNGTVKLWDLRQQKSVFSIKEMNEFVSDMVTTDAQHQLVCSCGDGSITSLNLTARKLHMQSEMYDVELNCLGLLEPHRLEAKLVVGTSDGKLLFFNWGEFGYHNNEFPGPKCGIEQIIVATDNIVISACDDGNIRATHLYPHRHLGVLGQHKFGVEAMDISGDGRLIASHACRVTSFWNIKFLEDIKVDGTVKADKRRRLHNLPSSRYKNPSDFFAGLTDDS